jgi:hypothetical protein
VIIRRAVTDESSVFLAVVVRIAQHQRTLDSAEVALRGADPGQPRPVERPIDPG